VLPAADAQGVGTLEKAFERYLEAEKLEGKNAFMCQKCASKQTALKGQYSGSCSSPMIDWLTAVRAGQRFLSLPYVLSVQLKR
jgi:hypothetical protein